MPSLNLPVSESSTVEFKQELPKSRINLLKTIVAFANSYGGTLYIGISDSGSVVGLSDNDAAYLAENLPKQVFESVSPPLFPGVSVLMTSGRSIVAVAVSPGTQRPYFLTSEGMEKGCYIRVGRSSLRATQDVKQELMWRGRGVASDEVQLFGATQEDIDEDSFLTFVKARRATARHGDLRRLLLEYSVLIEEHGRISPSRGGMLCFGKSPQRFLTESFLIVTHFKGTKGREAVATLDCVGTIEEQYESAMNFLQQRLSRSFSITSSRREDRLEVPPIALREIVLNMLAHRDYAVPACGKIALFDDRIEFFSPGQLPGPFETSDLEFGISYIRNPVITRILREQGFIEKLGSGYPAIYSSCQEWELARPEVINGKGYVKVIIFRGRQAGRSTEGFSDTPEENVLKLIHRRGEVTSSEVGEHLNVSRATVVRILDTLRTQGKILRKGRGRATRYTVVS